MKQSEILSFLDEVCRRMQDSGLQVIDIQAGEICLRLERACAAPALPPQPAVPVASASVNVVTEAPPCKPTGRVITSPIVGTFYAAPSPEEAPFVTVGQKVSPGDTLCIIEAMKMMNEIEAETEGVVTKVLVQNGQLVEYGQALFELGDE